MSVAWDNARTKGELLDELRKLQAEVTALRTAAVADAPASAALRETRAEAALRASEERLNLALTAGAIGAWDWDLVREVSTISDSYRALFGVPPEAPFNYDSWLAAVHPDDRARCRAYGESLFASPDAVDWALEFRINTPHRGIRWHSAIGRIHRGADGAPLRFTGVTVDITEHKQAEEALRERERQLALVIDAAPVLIAHCDRDCRLRFVNEAWAEFFAVEAERMVNVPLLEAVGPVTYRNSERHIRDVLAGRPVEFELEIASAHHGLRHMQARFAPEVVGGDVRGFVAVLSDITARKQAEAELRASEKRFRRLADTAPAILWTSDVRNLCTFLSYSWYQLTGQCCADALGFGWLEMVHPDDRKRARQVFLAAAEKGEPFEIEYRLRTRDGDGRWVIDRGQPHFDELNCFLGYVGSLLDVHDRRQSEEALRRAHGLIESITQGTEDLIAAEDNEYRYTFFNDAYQREFKRLWGREIKVGTSMVEALTPWPDQQQKAKALWSRALQGESFSVTADFGPSEAERQVYDLRYNPLLDAEGHIIGAAHILRNVTAQVRAAAALRESEERFRTMADGLPLMLWVHGPDGAQQFVNRTFCEFFGVNEEEMRGVRWRMLIHPADFDDYVNAFQDCLREQRPFRASCRVRRADGEWRWLESYGQPRLSTSHKFLGFVGASVDVTERKALEAQRDAVLESERAARSAMENLSRAKDEFVSLVSHELRSPLATVLGWSRLLQQDALPPEAKGEAVDAIVRGSQQLKQLIDDLLDISRLQSGKLQLSLARVDLAALARETVADFQPQARERGVRLEADLAERVNVHGDAGRLRQVLNNLLSNALKFTPAEGWVRVSVTADGDSVLASVADSGIGIAPDVLPRLFERFRQADTSITRKYKGLGLGLALVRQIAELHGGSVEAQSAGQNQGATFVLTLPRLSEHDAAHGEAGAAKAADLDGLRILVVDDDPSALSLTARLLQEAGAEVTRCDSADAAHLALAAGRHDVLVSDISMPEKDGYMLLREVRALPDPERARIPAIAVTAFGLERDHERSREAGFQAHHTKPIDAAELCALVRDLAAPPASS